MLESVVMVTAILSSISTDVGVQRRLGRLAADPHMELTIDHQPVYIEANVLVENGSGDVLLLGYPNSSELIRTICSTLPDRRPTTM